MWRLLLGTMGVKSLVQGLNAAATAGFKPRTVWSEVRRRNRIGHCERQPRDWIKSKNRCPWRSLQWRLAWNRNFAVYIIDLLLRQLVILGLSVEIAQRAIMLPPTQCKLRLGTCVFPLLLVSQAVVAVTLVLIQGLQVKMTSHPSHEVACKHRNWFWT